MWPSLFAESVSRNSCLEWDAVSGWQPVGKACPALRADSGTWFPLDASTGKCVPLLGQILGWIFRWWFIGKVHPIPKPNTGTGFPVEASTGNRIPFQRQIPGRTFRTPAHPKSPSHSGHIGHGIINLLGLPSIKGRPPGWRARSSSRVPHAKKAT